MRVLFTGASSFTGYWFVRELVRAGHKVLATFRSRPEDYADEVRRKRATLTLQSCEGAIGCSFGDERFLEIAGQGWDVLCHHAAEVTNYKDPGFDAIAALESNTRGIAAVVDALQRAGSGCPRIVLTGSVFENDEGAGSERLPAFSPYGLSKGLTWQVFRYYAGRAGVAIGKFVIPNPFGPYEDPRFTSYLMKTWFAGKKAAVNTPLYVRDNIHVSLLALAYARFVSELPERPGESAIHPSGYPGSQGSFASRFAMEMQKRVGVACELDFAQQREFTEPRVRINTDLIDGPALGWDEEGAWDDIAHYYAALHGASAQGATAQHAGGAR